VIPTSNHNEALSGDVLYSAFLNHEWRKIVLPFIIAGMAKIAAGIEDESDRQDFEVLYGAMIDDFYNEDVVDGTPVGAIMAFVGEVADIPAKWLLCNGATKNNADYPELAAIMPPIWDGVTQFVLPDLRTRFLRGAANDAGLGSSGGENSHTLTIAELPVHNHQVPAHSHTFASFNNAGAGGANVVASGLSGGASTKTSSTQAATNTSDTGSATPFDNQPSFITFHWIIKALP
jgi:microcystin-dependent protein